MHLAPTASRRVYQQRIGRIMRLHPRKEAGIVVDSSQSATHNDRVISLHSLLDADFYREGAQRHARAATQAPAPREALPHAGAVARAGDPGRRTPPRRDPARSGSGSTPKYLDEDEQRYWATFAGGTCASRTTPSSSRSSRERGASKGALAQFLATCAAENPNRRLRMIALSDHVSTPVDGADFDDLVTLVTRRRRGKRTGCRDRQFLLRAIADGHTDAPADPRAVDLKLARASRSARTVTRAPSFRMRNGCLGALANSRGHRHEENTAKLVDTALAQPPPVGATLLASAEGYTPRATSCSTPRARSSARSTRLRRPRREPAAAEGAAEPPSPPQAQAEADGRPGQPGGPAGRGPAERGEPGTQNAQAAPDGASRPPRRGAPPQAPQARVRHRLRRSDHHTRRVRTGYAVRRLNVLPRRGRSDSRRRTHRDRVPRRRDHGTYRRASCPSSRSCSPVAPAEAADGRTRSSPGSLTMFVFSILFASYSPEKLGLPPGSAARPLDRVAVRRAATLIFPKLALLVEHTLAPLSRRRSTTSTAASCSVARSASPSSPCGGPFLAYVSAPSATLDFGFKSFALAVSYALGASVVLLAIAVGGRRGAKPLHSRALGCAVLGVIVPPRRGSRHSTPTRSFRVAAQLDKLLQEQPEHRLRPRQALPATRSSKPVQTRHRSCRLPAPPRRWRQRSLDRLRRL